PSHVALWGAGGHANRRPGAGGVSLADRGRVHGKFFDIGGDGREPVVPVEELLDVLVDGGYAGYISSEYEGWHWNTRSDAFAMVIRHQALIRRVLEKHAAPAEAGDPA